MPRAKSKTTMAPGMESIGHWVFLLGVFIAIVAGFLAGANATIIWVLAILGLLVGLLNLKTPDIHGFLLAVLVLIVSASSLNVLPMVGALLGTMLQYIVIFVAPAALVIALKAVYNFASRW